MSIKDLPGLARFIETGFCLFGDEQIAGDFKYTASGGEVTITGYTGSAKDVAIPDRIDNLPVTVIESRAFEENQLTELIIPNSVTVIGDRAFADNPLIRIDIPANVDIQVSSFNALLYANYTASGRKAAVYTFSRMRSGDFEIVVSNGAVEIAGYHGEKRTDLTIPERINNLPVMAIGSSAFEGNQLTGLIIPNSVTAIGKRAFERNQLTYLVIPNSVTIIGDFAFATNRLTHLAIPDSVTEVGNCAFWKNQLTDIILPDSVIALGEAVFWHNQLAHLMIPDSVDTIRVLAFGYNQLTHLTIPDSVTVIEPGAFTDNQLTELIIPGSVTEIRDGAFEGNPLTSVTIPANVDIRVSSFNTLLYANYIANGRQAAVYTFSRMRSGDFDIVVSNGTVEIAGYHGEKRTEITIPEKINNLPVVAIGTHAFGHSQLTALVVPDSVTAIGVGAFANNQLTSITIGNSVKTIGSQAFAKNQLISVIIPDSVVTIGGGAFRNNQLTSVVISDSVTEIGYYAFVENQLTLVTIPDSVVKIGCGAFKNNQLTSVVIPDSVTEIGCEAFKSNQLTSVTIPANVDIQVSSFNTLLYLHYTANDRKAFVYTFSRMRSGDFEIVVFNGAVEITGCHGEIKAELTIPEKINNLPVVAIGSRAFYKNRLTGVTIPANMSLGTGSFPGNFEDVYGDEGKQAGTYVSLDNNGKPWESCWRLQEEVTARH